MSINVAMSEYAVSTAYVIAGLFVNLRDIAGDPVKKDSEIRIWDIMSVDKMPVENNAVNNAILGSDENTRGIKL